MKISYETDSLFDLVELSSKALVILNECDAEKSEFLKKHGVDFFRFDKFGLCIDWSSIKDKDGFKREDAAIFERQKEKFKSIGITITY